MHITGTCVLVTLAFAIGAAGAPDPDEPPNPLGCVCSDVDPRDDFIASTVE